MAEKKLSYRARKAFIVMLITITFYYTVDWLFGYAFSPPSYAGSPERLNSAAYRDEKYFSETFLQESFTQPGGWNTVSGTRLIFPHEYNGEYFNTELFSKTGIIYRKTLQSGIGSKIILVLGGSTVYNSEVPDDLTLPSQLAALLGERMPNEYFVLNAGVTSSNTSQELERLEFELSHGLTPDLVISYSGFNDVFQGVYYGNPEGVMFSHDQRNQFIEYLKKLLPLNIYRFVRIGVETSKQRSTPAHLSDIKNIEDLANLTKKKYISNISRMNDILAEKNIPFVVFLQPNITSGSCWPDDIKFSVDVQEFMAWADFRIPMGLDVLALGQAKLKEAVSVLKGLGVETEDLSELFCGRLSPVFLDAVHVNSVGNEMIAHAIFRKLEQLLISSSVKH